MRIDNGPLGHAILGPDHRSAERRARNTIRRARRFRRRTCRCSITTCGSDLKYGEGQTYLPSALYAPSPQWDWKHNTATRRALNVSGDLAEAMKTNPRLKVMVNGGYYDLATPFFAAQYEEKHLPIPQSLAKNIEYDWYESGHMVYVRDECREAAARPRGGVHQKRGQRAVRRKGSGIREQTSGRAVTLRDLVP